MAIYRIGDNMKWMLMVAVLLLAGGCTSVPSTVIVGGTPLNIEQNSSDWEGKWVDSNGTMAIVKVKDGKNGVLQVGWLGEDDTGNLKLELSYVYLRKCGEWTLATLTPHDESAKKEPYEWGRIEMYGNQCIIWSPSEDKFRPLVAAGILPGRAGRQPDGEKISGVELDALTPEHLAVISSDKYGVLFEWEIPWVFFKMKVNEISFLRKKSAHQED